jgi:hypothetical protein
VRLLKLTKRFWTSLCTNYPPEESIVEILDQWLRNFPGRPTWRDVTSALRKISLQQLANDIEMVYKAGI